MVITSNTVLQKAFINFQKLQPKTNETKNSEKSQKNMKNCTIFTPITPKIDLLTLTLGHPRSCTTLNN